MEQASERSVKLPIFNGSADKFVVWWTRFSAYAMVYSFVQAIGQAQDADLPAKESDAADNDAKKAAVKANKVAFASLTMAFTTEG